MERRKSALVGFVSFILLVGLALLILWQSDIKFRTTGYKLVGTFGNIGGLLKGADIRYRGYRVGRVSTIRPAPDVITVDLWIKHGIKIPIGSQAKVLFDGLVGENYVGISPKTNEDIMLKHNDDISGISGSNFARFIDLGSQSLSHAEAILIELRHLMVDEDFMGSVKNIVGNVDLMSGNLNSSLVDLTTTGNFNNIQAVLNNIKELTETLNKTSKTLLEDEKSNKDFKQIRSNLVSMSENLRIVTEQSKKATDDETIKRFKNTIKNLENISGHLNEIFEEKDKDGKKKKGKASHRLLKLFL